MNILKVDSSELWPCFILLPGLLFLFIAFGSREAKAIVLPGCIMTGIGIFFLLWTTGLLDYGMARLWPVFPGIVGLSFIIMYIYAVRERSILITAGILLTVSVVFFMVNFGAFPRDAWRYWPLILVAIGLWVIFGDILDKRGKPSR